MDDRTVPWRRFLADTELALADVGVDSPAAEARWMLAEVTGRSPTELLLVLDEPATRLGVTALDAMVARRRTGEPLQYVLGSWSFRSLDLLVDSRVLIPRPETEQLVDVALAELDRGIHSSDRSPTVVDLGTGSGAIALSLAVERPGLTVMATDRSPEAVAVARANLAGIGRAGVAVTILEGSWFEALPGSLRGTLDLVVSNPPYVGATETLPAEVACFEPAEALVAGPSGTEALEHLLTEAAGWLAPGASMVLELAPHQADELLGRAVALGYAHARVEHDDAGRARNLVVRTAPAAHGR
jgi:release factor glutamine methyltransferase